MVGQTVQQCRRQAFIAKYLHPIGELQIGRQDKRKNRWLPDVRLQYAQLRKRRRGWRVSFLNSIIRLGSRQLIRSGLKALSLTGKVQTAFVERANLTLRELIAPLSRRTWSIAFDRQHLHLHIQWGLAYYHFCRPHQS